MAPTGPRVPDGRRGGGDLGRRPGPGPPSVPGRVPVRIRVDETKCTAHARCYGLAPELFSVDDYGPSSVVGDGTVIPSWKARPGWPSPTAPSWPSRSCPEILGVCESRNSGA
ncbi:MAG: ferredoxin [Acidimicrobiales bacterium]